MPLTIPTHALDRMIAQMTDAKFTPGPWHVEPERLLNGMHVAGRTPFVSSQSGRIAQIRRKLALGRDEFADANAHLIAAAPDGYAVADEAANFLLATFGLVSDPENPRGWSDLDAFNVYKQLRAFQAKARGEQP